MKLRERIKKYLKRRKEKPEEVELSIIIPTLNEEKYLPKLLDSLVKQTYKNFEVIIVDGNSKDRTKEVANSFKQILARLSFYIERKKSCGRQRNIGANHAKGKYLLFLDADVILKQKAFLKKTIKEFKKRKLDIATCRVKPISGDIRDKLIFRFFAWIIVRLQRTYPIAQGCCIFSTPKIHRKIKGFDTAINLGEDVDYVNRASKVGNFRVLKRGIVYVSIRRLKMEGRLKFFMKYLATGVHYSAVGPVKEGSIIKYKFGEYK